MAITNIDSLILNQLNKTINMYLSNSKVLKKMLLQDLDEDIVNSFIHTYCTDNGNQGTEIPIYTMFPNEPPTTAYILCQFEASEEDVEHESLGNVVGDFISGSSGQEIQETLDIKVDDNKNAYVETTYPISEVLSVVQVSKYNQTDTNKIEIPYIDVYSDTSVLHKLTVFYSMKDENPLTNNNTLPLGVEMKEKAVIDFLSPNLDVLRCLQPIMLAANIYLKQQLEQNSNVHLPFVNLQGSDQVATLSADNSPNSQNLYYRRMTITYKVTQAISQNMGVPLKEIKEY